MPRFKPRSDSAFGGDSFMDIVANVVGILIILVICVGVRAKLAPASVPVDERDVAEIAAIGDQVHDLETDAARTRARMATLASGAASRLSEQSRLHQLLADKRDELEELGAHALAAEDQRTALQKEYSIASAYLERLNRELAEAQKPKGKTTLIESYPTPISRTVDGDEAHFQLLEGRITYVPLEDLLSKLRSSAVNQIWRLKDQSETTDTIGPIGGFRMRYTMERVELHGNGRTSGGTFAQLSEWTLVPVQGKMGEPVEQALGERSNFRRALAGIDPRLTSITIWTYPDSFAEFRVIKKELFRLGYATAGRPLPEGHPIGGSPQGSKSSAQ
ncbi:MAG: hypothetical protein AB7O62_24840 [Pirellulales bacterium]